MIKTNRLFLEDIKRNDIEWVYRALSNNEVTKYYGVQFNTLEETKEQMDWYEELLSSKTGIWWKLTLQENRKPIGACGFNNYNEKIGQSEIGFWLFPKYWKKGYMREALKSVIRYGFETMALKIIYAEVEEENKASLKVLENIGFCEKPEKAFIENKGGTKTQVSVYHLEQSGFLDL